MKLQRRQLVRMLAGSLGSGFLLNRSPAGLAAVTSSEKAGVAMEKVTGSGGLFFRAKDPDGLAKWYEQHLGIAPSPTSYGGPVWTQEAGETVLCPFPETTKYFGDATKMWMVNFRVRSLDKMVAQLQAAGIAVKVDPETYPNGRFARVHDPEGNPIELWEPAVPKAGH
jgi:predicted enzyme related to lactoylglutathione lyase